MIDVLKDVSTITNIPEKYLLKITEAEKYSICESITELNLLNDVMEEFDLGIGKLIICLEDEIVKYKFIPSESLENTIKDSIKSGKNEFELKLDSSLCSRVESLYRDLF